MKLLQKILMHLLIALPLTVGIIIYVDNRNPNMEFLRSTVGNGYLYALCIIAALSGILQLYDEEKKKRDSEPAAPSEPPEVSK